MFLWLTYLVLGIMPAAHADIIISSPNPRGCELIRKSFELGADKAPCEPSLSIASNKDWSGFEYLVVTRDSGNGLFYITIENLMRKDELDWQRVGWTLEVKSDAEREFWVGKRIADFRASVKMQKPLRDAAFMIAAQASSEVTFNPETLECAEKATGKKISCDEAEERFLAESPRHREYVKAVTELGANMGLGRRALTYIEKRDNLHAAFELSGMLLAGWGLYYATIEINRRDFDYDWSSEKLAKKWGGLDGVRFDNNPFIINMGHVPTGAWYYQIARVSNHNILESLLVAVTASFLWETLVEYREVCSINDMITTPVGGMAVGEVFYQLGEYFNSGADTMLNKVLAGIFGHTRALDSWIFKNKPKRLVNVDANGFSLEAFHDFRLRVAGGATTAGGSLSPEAEIGLSTEIITIPEYERPETVKRRVLVDGNFTEFMLKSAFGANGLNEFMFFTRAALAGYYTQQMRLDERGRLEGYSFFVGAATTFDLETHKTPEFTDQLGIVSVVGPTMDVVFHYKGMRIRAVMDVFADFAVVRSYALDEWARRNPGEVDPESGERIGIKSVLSHTGTYFAYGATGHGKLVAAYGGAEAGADIVFDVFESLDGRDRHQSQVTNDFHLSDQRRKITFWGAYRLPSTNWKLGVSFEELYREGKIENVTVKRSDKRITGYASYEF